MLDLNDKINNGGATADGQLDADEWNQLPSEVQNVIEGLGITLSGGDVNQLGKAIAGYVANGNFYTDSGAANAYVLTSIGSKQSLTAYTDGDVFEFIADNPNTGASTVNVATLGVKNIKLPDGSDPAAGQIAGRTTLKYDAGNNRCELQQSSQKKVTVHTSSGTHTSASGAKSIKFYCTGAGGGGGGADGQGSNTAAIGAGGGGGGTAILTTNNVESSYTITIGSGGTAGASTGGTGGDGGDTTVVSSAVSLTGEGGIGGSGMVGTASSSVPFSGDAAGASGGDLNLDGNVGSSGAVVIGDRGSMGESGGSIWGGSVRGKAVTSGVTSTTPGGGGGGAGSVDVATNFEGGAGADGVIVVEETF